MTIRVRAASCGLLLAPLLLIAGAAASAPLPGDRPAPGAPAPSRPDPADAERLALEGALLRAPDMATADAVGARLEALRMSRLSPTTRLLLNRAQRELAAGTLRDSRDDLDDALELQPDAAVLWRERATVRATEGDLDGAVADLGGALSRDPGDILSWSALSAIEERRGQPRQAYEAWERVLRLDPMIEGGATRLQRLHRQMVGAPS